MNQTISSLEFYLNIICENLSEVRWECEEFYEMLACSLSHMLVIKPDEMCLYMERIYGYYTEADEKIRLIQTELERYMAKEYDIFVTLDLESDEHLIDNSLGNMKLISVLNKTFMVAYERYKETGASGDPADKFLLLQWQDEYCKKAPEIMSACGSLLEYMSACRDRIELNEHILPNMISKEINRAEFD